ncbi:MAG TPA: GyrI-like domain-containing protein [Bacteroidia bacterium]|nr:GyrI-like domain-containing protein [Bacteroidia bacterium]
MKKIGIAIVVLIIIYFILAIAGPSNVKVERSITINRSSSVIKPFLTDLKVFHDKWSPWTEKDPTAAVVYSGVAGEVGHQFTWSSKNDEVGTGTLAIAGFNGDSVLQKLTFEGMDDTKVYYVVKDNNGNSEVIWGMQMSAPFLFRPMMLFMNMDKMIGPDYESGLLKLKTVAEEMKEETQLAYEVKEIEWPETYYVGTKFETHSFQDLAAFFGKNFPALGEGIGKSKVQPLAAPLSIYKWYDEKKGETNCAAAFRVDKGVKLNGFENHTYPACKVLQIAYYGAYEKIGDAHRAMDAYMKGKGLMNGDVFEEYVTDPMSEKDTAKWLTNVYYTLK